VEVKALVTILTVAIQIVELALTHLAQVVLVQVVTSVALFTERFEPVLADIIVVVAGVVMTRV